MKRLTLACLAAVLAPSLAAGDPGRRPEGPSPDWVAPRARIAAPAWRAAVAAEAVTAETVGDPDSFGRPVRFLGLAQTLEVALDVDCSWADPAYTRCVVPAAAPGVTTFAEEDLARIELPARSARSLLCFALTPFLTFQFGNDTGVPQPSARWTAVASIVVESPVLADPTLVDPNTGLPFGGRIVLPLGTYRESRSLAPGERASKSLTLSRTCVGGLMSKQALTETYGLTPAQAAELFRKPITLRFGATGSAQLVDFASYFYGVRLYGD